ncbi:MAG: hypothetical protein U1E70_11145 [Acetobacteraceae bacterium]|nr:hypothetical protein [Pseudomonadota bacterium]
MLRWLRAYIADDDPYVGAANFIAVMLAWNQPYYPLYLWWIVGRDAWVAAPFAVAFFPFFAIPAITRRAPLLGKMTLVVVATVNIVFCSAMLGEAAGIQLLYLPCGMLAAILYPWRERMVMLVMTGLPLVVWLLTRERFDHPPVRFTPEAYASLFTLNAVSAGLLIILFGWLLAGIGRASKPSCG